MSFISETELSTHELLGKMTMVEESERMEAVSLLRPIFCEDRSSFASENPELWHAYLGRFNDISPKIRIKCIQSVTEIFLFHEELQSDLLEAIQHRFQDSDDSVRFEIIKVLLDIGKEDFGNLANTETLLEFLKERTMDRKFKLRRETIQGKYYIVKY